MVIKTIKKVPHFMKLVQEILQRCLVGIPNCFCDCTKVTASDKFVKMKWCTFKSVDWFFTPPEAVVRNAIEACHEKSTAQYNIKLMEGHQITLDVLVCRGNQNLDNIFLREARSEQGKLIHVPNLCPCL